jgi:hypothetical protein
MADLITGTGYPALNVPDIYKIADFSNFHVVMGAGRTFSVCNLPGTGTYLTKNFAIEI